MPRKDVNEVLVQLAGINAKLDALTEMLQKHDGRLTGHDDRLRSVEKHMNIAFGWAGAIGFVASLIATWISDKLGAR